MHSAIKYYLLSSFLFLIVGCATVNPLTDNRNANICYDFWQGCTHSSHEIDSWMKQSFYIGDVLIETDYSKVAYPKAEAINYETGKKVHYGHTTLPGNCKEGNINYESLCPKFIVLELCKRTFGSECAVSRFNDEIYFNQISEEDLKNYYLRKEQKKQLELQKNENERLAILKKQQDAFNKLYNICTGYGFSEQDKIAACIQQEIFNEKKLAILKEQQLAQLQYTNNQQTKEKEETGFWLQVLEGVAENLADPNTWENARQNAEIQRLKNQQRRTIPKICSGTSCN